jgi:Gluconate 2-dehydrogenase subunit 3
MSDGTNRDSVSRRDMIVATAAALATPLVDGGAARPRAAAEVVPYAPKFFTSAELALLDELSELIIPTDDYSPGARIAGVAPYIDFRLSESLEPEEQARWRSGLAAVEALSKEMNGKPFLQGSAEERLGVLTRMAAAEQNPKAPAELFFRELKGWTVRAYYTSKVGIHADQHYKGNVVQPGEYAGYDAK